MFQLAFIQTGLAFIKRWQYIIIAVLWVASLGIAVYKTNQITTDLIEGKTNKAVISTTEKRNEISNNRPDTDTLFDGLLNDPNW